MDFTNIPRAFVAAAFVTTATIIGGAALAETMAGSNMDSRVLVAVTVDIEDVQAMLPDGWMAIAYPKGPTAGGNLLVSFEDRFLGMDAEGKPREAYNGRTFALLGLAKQTDGDQVRLFVLRVLTSFEGQDPFGNASLATIERTTSTSGASAGGRDRSERWTVAPADGGEITLALDFTSGRPLWVDTELQVFSNTNTEFSVINRYQQVVDVAMSAAMNKTLDGTLSLESSVPELQALFDGTFEPVAVMDMPVYVRKQFLP